MIHFKPNIIFKVEKLCLTIYWIKIFDYLLKPDLCFSRKYSDFASLNYKQIKKKKKSNLLLPQ